MIRNLRAWATNPRNRRALVGLVAAAVLLALLLRRRAAAAAAAAPLVPTTTSDVGPLVDPSSLTDGTPSGLTGGDSGSLAGDTGGVSPITDATQPPLVLEPGETVYDPTTGTFKTAPDGAPLAPDPGDASTSTPSTTTPTAANPSGTAAKTTTGFWWTIKGRQTWVTSKNRGAFLSELGSHGVSVSSWAAQHPDAARAVGIPVPATPPPRKPGPSSPAHETGGAARSQPTSQVAAPTRPAPAAATVLAGAGAGSVTSVRAPSTFSWGGRTWGRGDRGSFTSWLRAHGSSYAAWAPQHPDAARLLG